MTSSSPAGNKAPIPPGMRTMGRKLQNARRDAGLTRRDARNKLGVSRGTMRNWETGRYEPNDQFKQRLAELYNVNIPDLIRPDDPEEALGLTRHSRIHTDPKRLKLGRTRASLSLEEAADRSGISRSTVARCEAGTAKPTRGNLEILAALYGRPASWFVPRERMRRAGKLVGQENSKQAEPYDDEVTEAYGLAQPDLTNEAIRSIVNFIRFRHDQELTRPS